LEVVDRWNELDSVDESPLFGELVHIVNDDSSEELEKSIDDYILRTLLLSFGHFLGLGVTLLFFLNLAGRLFMDVLKHSVDVLNSLGLTDVEGLVLSIIKVRRHTH
jgi:hypothetical protein